MQTRKVVNSKKHERTEKDYRGKCQSSFQTHFERNSKYHHFGLGKGKKGAVQIIMAFSV